MNKERVGDSDMNYDAPEIQPGLEEVPEITPQDDKPDIEVINGALEKYCPKEKITPSKDNDGHTLQ